MRKVTLSNLRAHKRRLVSTFAAVALGVAFLVGVLVQTATLQTGFDKLFDTESASVDAVVRSDRTLSDQMDDTIRPRIDGGLVDRVRALPGVADAQADVRGKATIIGKDGDALGGFGPPTLAMTWIDDPALNPYRIASGRAPTGPDEVAIDATSADKGDLALGDTATILTPDPVQATIVGLAHFGDQDSQAGVTATIFSPSGAQAHLAGGAGTVDRILVDAEPGTSQATLVHEIERVAPKDTQVITGEAFRLENRDAVDDVMGFLRPALLSFAVIALLVAAFSIYNTFAIIVAQRTREAAMLRAIGATRGQTLRAVLVEALLVGLLASAAGVGIGIGVAALLGKVLSSGGLSVGNGLELVPATLLGSIALGTVVTALCALGPAVRASRVTPMAALRETAVDRTGATFGRLALGGLLSAAAVGLVLHGTTSESMASAAGGVGAAVVALAVLGPAFAGPVGRFLGFPLRLRGVTGDLARQNAVRNPRRTSSSSTALMIGVAVVALFTVIGASLRSSLDHTINTSFGGDLVATAGTGDATFDPSIARSIADLPQVSGAAGFGDAPMRIDGKDELVGVSDPKQVAKVLDLGVTDGRIEDMTGASLAVSTKEAEDNGWKVGSKVPYQFLDGTKGDATVRAIFANTDFAPDLLADTTFTQGHGAPVEDFMVAVALKPGVSLEQGRSAVEDAVKSVPTIDVQDKQEFADAIGAQVNQILVLVYGMLALSIVIALIGIANTLSLSTFERTRELGLLRAIGQGRSQTRAMVRWESVVIAVFGTALGLATGIVGAWALVRSAGGGELSQFAIPVGQLTVVLALGALAGVGAALRPAARAAKLDPLQAIATA
ncbi:FtsX-like permease family protein [Aquihabitans sp. G128]|uniref:ABC transporter permease n=1 Tax=Aquihabitans sp. G128 TaxID=2849779 RepID=UPI001C2483BB|nr:FtsX-like permease family protein [Aquihabitans sp. G128]QXC62339.1 FtsX-like permease family protein [Aquihabitans sp. G128]